MGNIPKRASFDKMFLSIVSNSLLRSRKTLLLDFRLSIFSYQESVKLYTKHLLESKLISKRYGIVYSIIYKLFK